MSTNHEDWTERLDFRIRQEVQNFLLIQNISIADFSKEIGISITDAKRYLDGKRKLDLRFLALISLHFKININWLLTYLGMPYILDNQVLECTDTIGNPVDLEEFVFIPQYEVLASAGHGYGVGDETPKYPVAFRRSWLQRHVPVDFAQLSIISVKGDSMEGVLNDHDTILVNHTLQSPADGVYVIRMGNDLFVKRTQVLPHNRLKILSENPSYQPFEVDLNEQDLDFQVIGRVEAFFRKL